MKTRIVLSGLLIFALLGAATVSGTSTPAQLNNTTVADVSDQAHLKTASAIFKNQSTQATPDTTKSPITNNNSQIYIIHLVDPSTEPSEEKSPEAQKRMILRHQEPLVKQLYTTSGVTVLGQQWTSNSITVEINASIYSPQQIVELDRVEAIDDDLFIPAPETPRTQEDNTITTQSTPGEYTYGLETLDAPQAWDKFDTKGEDTKVAVIDGGVDLTHPDITLSGDEANNYEGGWAVYNFTTMRSGGELRDEFEGPNAPKPKDIVDNGHGTHVSGTVAGGDNTGTAIGVAPETGLMHSNTYDTFGYFWPGVMRSIDWAVENNADVIVMSLGDSGEFTAKPSIAESIKTARENGVIIVTSSGNFGEGHVGQYAGYQETVSVGATNEDNEIASYTSGATFDPNEYYGPSNQDEPIKSLDEDEYTKNIVEDYWENPRTTPFIVAPGSGVYSAEAGTNGLIKYDGTSMAAPQVGGIASLAISNHPDLTPDEFRSALRKTATPAAGQPSTRNNRQGYGLVNAVEVLEATNPDGYLTPQSLTVTPTSDSPNTTQIEVAISNENVIGDSGKTSIEIYENGTQTATIKPSATIASSETKTYTTEYNLTTTTQARNITIITEHGSKSTTIEAQSESPDNSLTKGNITITNATIRPATITENQTTTHTIDLTVANVSNDDEPDTIRVTAGETVEFSSPIVTVTDANSTNIEIHTEPTVSGGYGGTANQISFDINPDRSLNTTTVYVTIGVNTTSATMSTSSTSRSEPKPAIN